MCDSRLRRVVAVRESLLVVADHGGREEEASLLAYEGPPPSCGDFVVVHSGFALAPVDQVEATRMLAELARVPGQDAPDPRAPRDARSPDRSGPPADRHAVGGNAGSRLAEEERR